MTAWNDYLAAIGQLDDVRRDAAAAVAEQERAVQAAQAELAGVRHRIVMQRERIAGVATRAGRPLPVVEPHELDRRAAAMLVRTGVVDPDARHQRRAAGRVGHAGRGRRHADRSCPNRRPRPGCWPTGRRWFATALPYIWYALLAIDRARVHQRLRRRLDPRQLTSRSYSIWWCPFGAYLLGLISVGMLFGPGPDGRKRRGVVPGRGHLRRTVARRPRAFDLLAIRDEETPCPASKK